jgi:hypothetical protein
LGTKAPESSEFFSYLTGSRLRIVEYGTTTNSNQGIPKVANRPMMNALKVMVDGKLRI